MWQYSQSTGTLRHDGRLVGFGYAGCGEGKNNPGAQTASNIGPLPCGVYTIGTALHDKETGPLSMRLIPSPTNEMFGRSAFLIHGDSIAHPGEASHGCIILNHGIRSLLSESTDRELEVIA